MSTDLAHVHNSDGAWAGTHPCVCQRLAHQPVLTLGLALALAPAATADGPPAKVTADVLTFAELEPVEGATAQLVRGDDVLFTRTDTRGLDTGTS